jgi:hypothetical protein
MAKQKLEFKVTVYFMKEGNKFIAYSPAFDLSTCAGTLEQSKKRFKEAVEVFITETKKNGTLEQVLLDLGWRKNKANWQSPVFVGQETNSFAF